MSSLFFDSDSLYQRKGFTTDTLHIMETWEVIIFETHFFIKKPSLIKTISLLVVMFSGTPYITNC